MDNIMELDDADEATESRTVVCTAVKMGWGT